jgi:hypothetical protein
MVEVRESIDRGKLRSLGIYAVIEAAVVGACVSDYLQCAHP